MDNISLHRTIKSTLFLPYLWFLFSLTSFTLSKYDSFAMQASDISLGNKFNQLVFGGLMVIGWFVLYRRKTILWKIIFSNIPLLLLIGYTFSSVFWSNYQLISLRRFILFIGGLEMILILASERNSHKSFFDAMYLFCGSTTFLSLIMISFFHKVGISREFEGAWQGVAAHKNTFGQLSAVSSFFYFFLLVTRTYLKNKILITLLFILNLVFLYKSRSATGLFTFCVIFCFFNFLIFVKKQKQNLGIYLFCLIGILPCFLKILQSFFFNNSIVEIVTSSIGKDTTFTQRTEIWSFMLESIKTHPVLGCGFGGFWVGTTGQVGRMYNHFHWLPFQGHNGYLDIVNELGFVGMGIFIIFLISNFIRNTSLMKKNYELGAFWITILVLIILSNLMETSFMRNSQLYWFLFASAQILSFNKKCLT